MQKTLTARTGKVGERIRTARDLMGLSPAAFAKRIGKTERTIDNWEQDITSPTVRDIFRMCAEFKFTPMFFIKEQL